MPLLFPGSGMVKFKAQTMHVFSPVHSEMGPRSSPCYQGSTHSIESFSCYYFTLKKKKKKVGTLVTPVTRQMKMSLLITLGTTGHDELCSSFKLCLLALASFWHETRVFCIKGPQRLQTMISPLEKTKLWIQICLSSNASPLTSYWIGLFHLLML
jgi:hypothetical protein